MKRIVSSLLLAFFAGISLGWADNSVFKHDEEGKYFIETGDLTMTIDANGGGKILSFKCQGKEVINQSRMRETFGSTFWTSPQKEWYWPPVPEYDKQPYTVEEKQDCLVMTSGVSQRLKFRIQKEFKVDELDKAIVITYSIINEDDKERSVAPWEITRVPNDGIIFFDAPTESITPQGLLNFSNAHGVAWYKADDAQQNRKINADGKGWLAYANNGLLLVKKFQDLEPSQPAPDEAEIQVYVNMGKKYIELESQGAYTKLAPGERLNWAVRWYLKPIEADIAPSQELVDLVGNR